MSKKKTTTVMDALQVDAEYWSNLPSKDVLESKIREILHEARERLARRKSLSSSAIQKQIEYFFEPKDDDDENDE